MSVIAGEDQRRQLHALAECLPQCPSPWGSCRAVGVGAELVDVAVLARREVGREGAPIQDLALHVTTKSEIAGGQTFFSTTSARISSRSLVSLYGQIWMIWFSVPTSLRQKPASGEYLTRSAILSAKACSACGTVPGFSGGRCVFLVRSSVSLSLLVGLRRRLHLLMNAGMTSLAKRSSCSSVTASGVPSGMLQLTRSRPG